METLIGITTPQRYFIVSYEEERRLNLGGYQSYEEANARVLDLKKIWEDVRIEPSQEIQNSIPHLPIPSHTVRVDEELVETISEPLKQVDWWLKAIDAYSKQKDYLLKMAEFVSIDDYSWLDQLPEEKREHYRRLAQEMIEC